jgi:hypothetical protein
MGGELERLNRFVLILAIWNEAPSLNSAVLMNAK